IRSAFWHMLGDAWVSLGIVISGGAMLLTGWTVLDPLISLLVVVVIARAAWPLFKESLDVLLESTPPNISGSHVAETIEAVAGVKNVNDLHIWAVEPRLVMMTCHILVDGDDSALTNDLLHTIRAKVSTDFGIKDMTIQMGTACCHPDEIHCDLTTLAMEHKDKGLVHVHH
ncbi:MAG: cation diffusion facilitator family transporter, partial [Nitrospirota bacterium]